MTASIHLRDPGAVLLLSFYELGHAPHGLALPLGFLRRAGYRPAALDLAVDPLDPEMVARARAIALSVPMHTGLRLALAALPRIRELAPGAAIGFYGLYAALHADALLADGAAFALGGEVEEELARALERIERGAPPDRRGLVSVARLVFPPPAREDLGGPPRYARLLDESGERPAGYVEATRGCLDTCRHCPVPAVYRGRFRAIDAHVVLDDVAVQVAAGASHITFGDPDFLNGPGHGLRIVRAMRARFPEVTFDITAQVTHLLRIGDRLRELVELGCAFATTAVESLSERTLIALAKRHRRDDVERLLDRAGAAGLVVRPTFVPFTPWSELDDLVELVDFVFQRGLEAEVAPVQLTIRLLVPPGSLLLEQPELATAFDRYDRNALGHTWRHPDARMDELQAALAALVADETRRAHPPISTLQRIRAMVRDAAGLPQHPGTIRPRPLRHSPRLSEPWFC